MKLGSNLVDRASRTRFCVAPSQHAAKGGLHHRAGDPPTRCRAAPSPPGGPGLSTPPASPSLPPSSAPSAIPPPSPTTERIFAQVDGLAARQGGAAAQAQGAGGRTTFAAFRAADELWLKLRNMPEGEAAGPAPTFVRQSSAPLPPATAPGPGTRGGPLKQHGSSSTSDGPQYDAVVCGGTLGIFAAAALAARGLRVAVVERGPLRGRDQEWNISRKELLELQHVGVASREELEECIAIEFNPVRVGFAWQGGTEVWTRDVLNLGVSPDKLVQLMRRKLEAAGGVVLERTALEGIAVHPDGAALTIRADGSAAPSTLTARLVVDCMGHFSPIVRQVRWGRKPNGVCLVVGGMASGFPEDSNKTADVIFTNTPLQPDDAAFNRAQYFWEAFPAASGPSHRTTYMFSYLDAAPYRPSMAAMMEDYWRLMPQYQGVRLEDLSFERILFGFFPTFKDTPLKPTFDRIIQIGDASGLQSPLSFGGFGALTRHLARLTNAFAEALDADALDAASLGLIHAYNPGLASSWMMQKAMSVRQGDSPDPQLINRMLAGNFRAMEKLGEPIMKPFLQDVIQFGPMLTTIGAQALTDPGSVPGLTVHVGLGPMAEWLGHMGALGAYTFMHGAAEAAGARAAVGRLLAGDKRRRFAANRLLDAWEFGSGLDYKL